MDNLEFDTLLQIYNKLKKELDLWPEDTSLILKIGAVTFEISNLNNDKFFCKEAKKYFSKAIFYMPNNYIANLLYGTVLLREASLNVFQFNKMKLVAIGIEYIRKAVELSGNKVEIRAFLAKMMAILPPFFNMNAKALKEFDEIIKEGKLTDKLYYESLFFYCYLSKKKDYDKYLKFYKELLENENVPPLIKKASVELL